MAYPGCNLQPQGPQPTPAQDPLHGYLVTLKASDSEPLPPLYTQDHPDSHRSWPWLTTLTLLACPPHFPAIQTHSQSTGGGCSQIPPLLLGLGGYGVTAGPWHSSEPSRSWSMELHNFYGFLTPGGYSCSCSFSSSFKSNGELRDWEGGKFPNKQTLREGLSQARQWKEPDPKVPCKRGGCWYKDMAPGELGVEDTEGGFAALPTSFPATAGVTGSSGWMPCQGPQQGETVQGQSRHPGTQGWDQSSWGRVAGRHVRLLIVSREP